ncbi:sodium-dependent transporter [Alteraurantiacibacter aquimixticola]|uniref:Sodium-dependent transporter n=1 Tax=Alteraurantiacibacter aquimixticola TaxID=2489173 RepID=A0A4T3F0X3_9SPHN|nr:sodium-dependent transporter [Alteraurantiacibacter aquimixticola]TIX50197.1 sodium-dependent transporter [Alteraurantiacibacter aquimixticola]
MALSGTAASSDGWSSKSAFVLAAIGAAVGLGNIWRFPTLAGENGGGAFVLVYVLCVLLIGLPMLLTEILIGRAGGGHADAVGSVGDVAEKSRRSRAWSFFGGVEVLAAFLILSFYSVVAGWVLNYVLLTGGDFLSSLFAGAPLAGSFAGQSQEEVTGLMGALFESPGRMIALHAAFMAVTLGIVMVGVHDGIEKAAKWLMPAFFVLLVVITIYGAFEGAFAQAVAFLFTPDFSKLSPSVMNEALGQAFFSLSLGSAAIITYGSYVPKNVRLAPTAATIAAADTAVAILAGLMIFPIVFSAGLDPAAGPSLIFQSLPVAFQGMPGGAFMALAFFILIFFAALTSSISLLEGPTAFVIDRLRLARPVAAVLVAVLAFLIGCACALGYSTWSDVRLLSFWGIFENADILDSIDGITGRLMLPLAGLGLAIFIGWRADRRLVEVESGLSGGMFMLWRGLVAWLAPVAVFLILLFGLFPSLLGA